MDIKPPVILMLEDNPNVLHLNKMVMERQGFEVHCADTIQKAKKLLWELPHIDLAILDVMLPDGDGLAFASEVRAETGTAVLVLTSKDSYSDMLHGLSCADDYITKPYRIEELQARAVALLNKKVQHVMTLRKGPLLLDIEAQRAYLHEQDMLVQPREFAVLWTLARSENQSISSEQLYTAAWNQPYQGDGPVKTTISRLRKKLLMSGYTITVVRGEGYCFERAE